MGTLTPISLGFQTNPGRNTQAGRAELINCFAEELGQDGKVTIAIESTEGLLPFGSALSGGAIRAGIEVGGTAYVVSGRNVYAVNSSGVGTLIGGIATDGPVYMQSNRAIPAQIGIVSDGLYYVIDTGSNSLTQVNDPDLPSPISISFLDGFGVIPVINGGIYVTSIDDFTMIDGLETGNAEAYPDDIVRSATLEREAVFFGTTSIEWFQNTGSDPFPLTRVTALEIGCLEGDSVAKVDTPDRKTLIWVAPDHTVRMMNGYSGTVISTNEIEELIKKLDKVGNSSQLRGMAWAYAGRFFYNLTSNSWSRTFDSKTGRWCTRKSYGLDRWRVSTVFRFGNKIIAGDYSSGQLYTLDNEVFEDNGSYMVSEIITPTVDAFPYNLKFNALYLDAATGVGINSTSAHESNPSVLIDYSDDGGNSFKNERERSLGTDAEYRRIKPLRRLGRCGDKGRIFRFRISSPVERVFLQAMVDIDKLEA